MDFFRRSFALAAFLCCGIAVGQEVTYGTDPSAGGATSPSDSDNGYHSPLQEVIGFSDEQREELSRVGYALEDALFPIRLEEFQKYWELERAYRTEPPDEAIVMMIVADLERLEGMVESLSAEHRKMARAILNWEQLVVLGKLQSALELYWAALEAVQLNLIVEPEIFFFGSDDLVSFDGTFPEEGRAAVIDQSIAETTLDALRSSQRLAQLLARPKTAENADKQAR